MAAEVGTAGTWWASALICSQTPPSVGAQEKGYRLLPLDWLICRTSCPAPGPGVFIKSLDSLLPLTLHKCPLLSGPEVPAPVPAPQLQR